VRHVGEGCVSGEVMLCVRSVGTGEVGRSYIWAVPVCRIDKVWCIRKGEMVLDMEWVSCVTAIASGRLPGI